MSPTTFAAQEGFESHEARRLTSRQNDPLGAISAPYLHHASAKNAF